MVCSPRPAFAGPATLPTPCWVYELSSLQVTTFVRGSLGQCAMPAAADGGSGGRQVRKAAGAASITHCPLPSPACCVVAPLGAPGSMPAPEQRGAGPTAGGAAAAARGRAPGAQLLAPQLTRLPIQSCPKVLIHTHQGLSSTLAELSQPLRAPQSCRPAPIRAISSRPGNASALAGAGD